jgi:hypothetical protein
MKRTPEQIRADFERWLSENGRWTVIVERTPQGGYRQSRAINAWKVWQAAAAVYTTLDQPEQ